MLSDIQLKLVAETLSNIGVAVFASAIIPIIVTNTISSVAFFMGSSLSIIFWSSGLLIAKYVKS